MGLEALPDDQAAEIIAKREALGKMVLDLFDHLKTGERMIADLAQAEDCDPADFAVAEAAITFEWKEDGRDYRLSLQLDDGRGGADDQPEE